MTSSTQDWTTAQWRSFLHKARTVISSSLDYEETLQGLVGLLVPEHADWCAVDLLDDAGRLETVAVANQIREKSALVEQVRLEYPASMDSPVGPPNVVRTGVPELVPNISEELLQSVATDQRHLEMLRELGLRSYICAPLKSRGRIIGAISLVMTSDERRYEESDLELVGDLTEIAAIGLDNSRLFTQSKVLHGTLEGVLDAALDAVVIMDAAGMVVDWRGGSEQIFGWKRAEAVGQPVADLIIPERYRAAHWKGLERLLETGEGPVIGNRIEIEALRRDGQEFWIELEISKIETPLGIRFSAFIRDLTEQKRAQEEILRAKEAAEAANVANSQLLTQSKVLHGTLEGVLDAALDAVVIMDAAGMVVDWRGGSEQIFGWKRAEAVGQPVADLIIPERYRAAHWKGLERLLETGEGPVIGNRIEIEALRRDGQEFWIELEISKIETPLGIRFSAFIRDLTEQKRAQEEILRAKEAAEAANVAKSQFLANMSHELRTPLNAIIGYSEMLQEAAETQGSQALVDDLERIRAAGDHLLSLINDVLDLSKIEAGRMEAYYERIDLDAMVREVTDTVRPLVAAKDNTLTVDVDQELGWISSDLTKVRQILFNLLSNAAKFTQRGNIKLAVQRDEHHKSVCFRVEDSGIGMTSEHLGRLFQPFSQADSSTTRNFGGTGLGLAITKRFCEILGGSLEVSSNVGQGSTFWVRLPIGPTMDLQSPVDTPRETGGSVPTVLIIDDDPAARDLIARTLYQAGYETISAASGEEGLRLARSLRPTAITLDVMMPSMDGWSVLGAIKADSEICDIPVVMLTMVSEQNLAYSLGAADYITKPIDRKKLISVLDRFRCQESICDVLVVEDESSSLELVRNTLTPRGWMVHEARNGEEALRMLEHMVPDVVVLDLMMPHMDGFEFAERMRERPEWQRVPVIVVTAMDLSHEDRLRLNGHVERILRKDSLRSGDLLNAVQRVIPSPGRRV